MAKGQTEEIREVVLENVRVQLAALNAGIVYWSAWIESAGKFVQAADKELLAIGEKGASVNDVVGRLTDLSLAYLRRMTELPNLAVSHFNTELGKSGGSKAKRTRNARAKE